MSSYDLDGSSVKKDGSEKQGIREIIRDEIRQYLQDPLGFPEEYKGWLPEWITQAGIDIPIGQVIGFSTFAAQFAAVATQENSTSTTYGDIATVGPTLSGLGPGRYILFYGSSYGSAQEGFYSPMVNSTEAVDADALQTLTTSAENIPGAFAVLKDLDQDSNTVQMRYRIGSAGAGAFKKRWLIALKYSNL